MPRIFRTTRRLFGIVVLPGLLLRGSVAQAQITVDSVPSAARVSAFLTPAPSGPTIAAIIFDPASAASVAEAAQIERGLAGGLLVGSSRLVPKRIAITALANLRGSRIAFVTQGLRGHYTEIGDAGRGILTITSDRACVTAGKCVVGVSSGARIDIVFSRAALQSAGIRFGSMFAMLAREI